MRYDPIDEDHEADNAANKWSEQMNVQRTIGQNVDNHRHGELLNSDE